jgi:AraC-like DNA-binding protein/ligand-binding sensor protein
MQARIVTEGLFLGLYLLAYLWYKQVGMRTVRQVGVGGVGAAATDSARGPEGLAALMAGIAEVTGAGAVYHGLHDRALSMNARVCGFCAHCVRHPATRAFCRYACCDAALHAFGSGEPYFYRCWAGLLFVTVAVAPRNRCVGGVSLGGFTAPDAAGDVAHALEQQLASLSRAERAGFTSRLPTLQPVTPAALRGLGMYALEATFSGGLNAPAFFRRQNEKYVQQRRIAEAFAEVRLHNPSPPDIPRDAYQLLAYLERNDRQNAMRHLSTYLAKVLLVSNWDQDRLRAHLRVLLAVLTSQDILKGLPWNVATNRELRCLARLEKAETTEDSCYEIAEFIKEHFGDRRLDDAGSGTVAERAVRWLEQNLQEHCTLAAAARAIGVSTSTIVHRLKAQTGRTFRELRRETRLAQARKLLATTDLQISDIASLCGFFDQSHLTKALRLGANLTPRQFRRLLHPSKADILRL